MIARLFDITNKSFIKSEYNFMVTFETNDQKELENLASNYKDKEIKLEFKKNTKKRSLNANALLWKCLGDIANSLNADKWDIYLQMLKRYGKYTYICVKPDVVESVKSQWRECEELGAIDINGQTAVQLLCYFGSSTYDSKEFSVLLEGVMSEMHEIGLKTPEDEEIERSLKLWENKA